MNDNSPEAEDYELAKRCKSYAEASDAEKYRLAQAVKLFRLYAQDCVDRGEIPPTIDLA